MKAAADDFLLGIVEGFYGKPWSWEARQAYPAWLAQQGLNTYLYAPKSDPFLRSRWREDWPAAEWQSLCLWRERCREAGVLAGIGLSPIHTADFRENPKDQQALKQRLQRINILQPDLLAILFDDIPGSGVDARQQLAIMALVRQESSARRLLVCPSYYSHDPRLAEVFGSMPADYWDVLAAGLDADVDVFWTGNQVCSSAYTVSEFEAVKAVFRRPATLWDNYPVNDGKLTAPFLHTRPFAQRPAGLRQVLRGHLANPMNQPELSKIPLTSLAALYAGHAVDMSVVLAGLCVDAELVAQLLQDLPLFQEAGLAGLSEERRAALQQRYAAWSNEPLAREIHAWLAGHYRFDPDCLTG